jgi:putative chitinase
MAQVSHECRAGHDVVENLNYTPVRMTQVWPGRFPAVRSAEPYAGNPRSLADKVYTGRMGNLSGSDDGWNFRGTGASEIRGRD